MGTDKGILTGIHTALPDGKEFIALDYDLYTKEEVIEECRTFIDEYNLAPFHLLESTPLKWHAVCFQPLSPELVEEIIEKSGEDKGHKDIHSERGNSTIRISKKRGWDHPPRHIKTIESPHPSKEDTGLKRTYFKLLHEEQDMDVSHLDINLDEIMPSDKSP